MKNKIIALLIGILTILPAVVVFAIPFNNPKTGYHYCKKTGETKYNFWQLNTKSGNIHVWQISTERHAICMPIDRFTEEALESHYSEGWYDSSCFEDYICCWEPDCHW